MEKKIIERVVEIINKLDKEDSDILLTYAIGAESKIQQLANNLLFVMENNYENLEEEGPDRDHYLAIKKDWEIARENNNYLSADPILANKKEA